MLMVVSGNMYDFVLFPFYFYINYLQIFHVEHVSFL